MVKIKQPNQPTLTDPVERRVGLGWTSSSSQLWALKVDKPAPHSRNAKSGSIPLNWLHCVAKGSWGFVDSAVSGGYSSPGGLVEAA